MKEFLVYTGLRLGLFLSAFAVVAGIWLLVAPSDSGVPVLWPVLIAAVVSAIASAYLLKGPRQRFAAKVQARADRASAKFEEMRSREDVD